VAEYPEELAEPRKTLLEEPVDRLVGRVARRQARAPGQDHDARAAASPDRGEAPPQGRRVVLHDVVTRDRMTRARERGTDQPPAPVGRRGARVADRDHGARHGDRSALAVMTMAHRRDPARATGPLRRRAATATGAG